MTHIPFFNIERVVLTQNINPVNLLMFLKPMSGLITSHLILHTLIQYLCFVTNNLKKDGWSVFKPKFSSWKCRPPQCASHLQSQRQPGCLRRSVRPPTTPYSWPCSRSEPSSVSLFPGLSPSLCSNPELSVLGEWCVAAEQMNNVYNFTQREQMFPFISQSNELKARTTFHLMNLTSKQGNRLASSMKRGKRTNLMKPVWDEGLVTLSRSMKGVTGRPSSFSTSLWGHKRVNHQNASGPGYERRKLPKSRINKQNSINAPK